MTFSVVHKVAKILQQFIYCMNTKLMSIPVHQIHKKMLLTQVTTIATFM